MQQFCKYKPFRHHRFLSLSHISVFALQFFFWRHRELFNTTKEEETCSGHLFVTSNNSLCFCGAASHFQVERFYSGAFSYEQGYYKYWACRLEALMSMGGDSSLGKETSISTSIDLSVHMQTTAPIMILKEAKGYSTIFFFNINRTFLISRLHWQRRDTLTRLETVDGIP